MKAKLVFIVNVDWFFISHRLPIAIQAIKEDFEVHVICQMTKHEEQLNKLGIITHDISITRSGINFFSECFVLLNLYKIIRKLQPDILHLITIKPIVYGGLVAKILGIKKIIHSISGLGYVFIDQGTKAKILRCLICFLYRVIFSNPSAKVVFQNESDKLFFIQNKIITDVQSRLVKGSGVDLTYFEYIAEPDSIPVVMFVSRLLKDKGIMEFIAAANEVFSKGIPARFIIVGGIDINNPNSVTQDELNEAIGEHIELWGYSKNIQQVIAKSNIVVLPSYREGLPKVLCEAAAIGRAVITTDVPGCRDAIFPRKTGLLVKARDVIALSSAMKTLIKNVELRQEFGKAGRKFAEENFDIQDIVAQHIALYREGNLI